MSLPAVVQLEELCSWPVLDGSGPDSTTVAPRCHVMPQFTLLDLGMPECVWHGSYSSPTISSIVLRYVRLRVVPMTHDTGGNTVRTQGSLLSQRLRTWLARAGAVARNDLDRSTVDARLSNTLLAICRYTPAILDVVLLAIVLYRSLRELTQ